MQPCINSHTKDRPHDRKTQQVHNSHEGRARRTIPPPRQPSSSRGAKHIGGYFTPEVSRQLRIIAASEDTSIQNLLAESLDMLFHSRQMPTIAQNPASQ